jgi:hypothetical protein
MEKEGVLSSGATGKRWESVSCPGKENEVTRTVVSSKFGVSSLTKFQAAFSAKALLA